MARKVHLIHTCRGVNIYRNTEPGFRLRWSSGRLAADTLEGIKRMIREE